MKTIQKEILEVERKKEKKKDNIIEFYKYFAFTV